MRRVAIVTGGASGIGAALCRSAVKRGAHVVVADLDEPAAKQVAEELDRDGPGSAVAAQVDVADADDVTELVRGTHADHGRLDFLFNNAGIGVPGPPEELTLDHWRKLLDVNLWGVIHGCHAAYPLMLEQGSGRLVNTASLAGLMPTPAGTVAYGTSKHAVVGLSLAWRSAGKDNGVHVHAVCPGVIDTPILDKVDTSGLPTPPSAAVADGREWFRRAGMRHFYPPDALAEDVMTGLARDQAIIVSPWHTRYFWHLLRLFPGIGRAAALRGTRLGREMAGTMDGGGDSEERAPGRMEATT
ncbi:MAG: SDR family oxidoreductase [Nitriliruptorales bacterium]|nr:SDR family oxidoreductase [Nitriliruptorales bacterium]